ncbi:MAG: hypothetical protein K0R57_1066 [Paenibacillaceae bacterium]|jgi:hypothetical protein|nr:hypothetical protein [Paenibacillaceae bacterium]
MSANHLLERYVSEAVEILCLISDPVADPHQLNKTIFSCGGVNKVYVGYVSALGPSIIQLGLLPTLHIYSSKNNSSEGDLDAIIKLILLLLKKDEEVSILLNFDQTSNVKNLLDSVATLVQTQRSGDYIYVTQRIKTAAAAIKLVLRTYKVTDDTSIVGMEES